MKISVLLLAVASVAYSSVVPESHSAYGYLLRSVKYAERRQQLEEEYLSKQSRIIGGVPASVGQYPFQAGLLINIVGLEVGQGICGGSLIQPNRVISAAHCWFDGQNQGWRVEVVLGSALLFSGGQRQHTSVFVNHPNWAPQLARNDVGVIYLPNPVQLSSAVAPIALPSGSQLQESFANANVIASGFGLTAQGGSISANQGLNHVSLRVITNAACNIAFPFLIQESNICTSGVGTVGTCQGDSGGPLIVVRNNNPILIGVTSFGHGIVGCEGGLPSVYARVSSFIDFFNQHS